MSGIAGIIHFDGRPVVPGEVEAMTAGMHYRGPDGINHWRKGSVALGQCMLRTTPESLEENQPLTNEDESLVLVMDGRVDNWEELRYELLGKGAVLRTRADAELVLRAYEVWGKDCLPHIDGDFALVLWDALHRKVFCARDRMGSKPLNYYWNGKTLVFCSESHPIVTSPFLRQNLNLGVLAEYLAGEWYAQDETLWSGVVRLIAGHQMTVDARGQKVEEYWHPNLWETLPFRHDDEHIDFYRELVTDAVRRLSRSHQRLAIEVSGGLDSSAVYCIANTLRKSGRLPAPSIEGYTLAFADDAEADEIAYARAVGEYCRTQIQEVLPSRVPLSWFADRARSRSDFPGFANGTMAQNMLRQASAQGARAILNGVGGDEWLAGSRKYYAEGLLQGDWGALYTCFNADYSAFGAKRVFGWFLRHGVFEVLPMKIQLASRRVVHSLRGNNISDVYWLSRSMRKAINERREQFRNQKSAPLHRHSQEEMLVTRNDAYLALAREEAERTYARASLEPRRPLHTAAFVQYAFSTPERLRIKGDRDKYIHVQALRQMMPQSICDRKTKSQFSRMFRNHLDGLKPMIIDNLAVRRADWISKDGITELFRAYEQHPHRGWPYWILWSIYGSDLVVTAYEDAVHSSV